MIVGDTLTKTASSTISATKAPPTMILDENGKVPNAQVPNAPPIISGGMTRAHHVPSCDRRIVFSAIDGQLNAAKIAWREKNKDANDDEQPHTTAKVEFFVNCIERTGESLKRQIDIATVPVDEARVEGAVDSFRTRLLSSSYEVGDRGGSSPSSSSSSSVDDDAEEYEFEDDDIVDRDAYEQVKRLRAQAREVSSRVIAIREETTGKALDMTRRDLSELLRVHGFSEESFAEGHQSEEVVEDANAMRVDSLNPMRAALQTLVSSMRHVDPALAEKLEALKETIGTIDSSVEKYKRLSQGDDSGLSQTEKALLSIEHQEEYEAHSLGKEETESPMNPDRKLARLLAGVL